jgi:hypothetical protein
MLAHAQTHAQHHAAGGQRVIRHPFDEAAQFRLQRRKFELFLDILEPVVERRIGVVVFSPDHPGRFARAERHGDDVAGRDIIKLSRHTIGISPVQRDRHQHVDDPFGHFPIFGRFSPV